MHRLILAALLPGLAFAGFTPARADNPAPEVENVPAANEPQIETDLTHAAQPGQHEFQLHIGNWQRTIVIITPDGIKPGESLPVVFFLHGAGGNADQAARVYGWAEKAEAEHFFAVFPQGLAARPNEEASFLFNPHVWRDERPAIQARGVDDVAFFSALLDQLEAALPVDKHRVYVTGFSNGGGMSFTLGAHFSNRIAAIAPVSSETFITVTSLARPLPVYFLIGKADPLVPFNGGEATLPWGTRTLPPVMDTVDTWVKLDGCPGQPQVLSDDSVVRVVRYGPGHAGVEILFTTIEGNGHHWPGAPERLPAAMVGPSLNPFNATDRIWDFFKAHPLP